MTSKAATEILYGVNPVLEALRSGRRRCHEVWVAKGRQEQTVARIAEEAARRKVALHIVAREELTRRAETERHQGVAARVDPYPSAELAAIVEEALVAPRKGFVVILDGVTDPQNLGSLVRTAHLLGVHGIILPKDNAAAITPSVVKASAGATEYLPIARVTNLVRTVEHLKEAGFWVSAIEAGSELSVYDQDFRGHHVALVMGSEGGGIRRLLRERSDHVLFLPMEGKISSYNVSAAGALAMGEVARQRRLG